MIIFAVCHSGHRGQFALVTILSCDAIDALAKSPYTIRMTKKSTQASSKPYLFQLNRETQFLAFNRRVLALVEDTSVPLLERVRFMAIVSSNLDEFFEIRVAGLKEQRRLFSTARFEDGLSVNEALAQVDLRAHAFVADQYDVFNNALLPALAKEGIRFLSQSAWSAEVRRWLKAYFLREVLPVLTPVSLAATQPFPRVFNKSLNFVVALSGDDAFGRTSSGDVENLAFVALTRVLPRVVAIPKRNGSGKYCFVFLAEIVRAFVGALFRGLRVSGCYAFRVTRNSDLFIDDEEVKNLRIALQGELPQRHFGDAVRLEVASDCPATIADILLTQLELTEHDLYRIEGPINLARLIDFPAQISSSAFKYPPFVAGLPRALAKRGKRKTIFDVLKKEDVLLHHPFQNFLPVIEFIESAAKDPDVLAIKQTVYRIGANSLLMEALIGAARSGKDVTVVVELMARFDEEANLNWAARLEAVGAHVIYGVVGHKTHAKMALVVRREHDGAGKSALVRYAHLGTGNYHAGTTASYTDFGLMTSHPGLCEDVAKVFVQLTGLGRAQRLTHLWQAPFTLHRHVIAAIAREARHAKAGKPTHIIAKMNALTENDVIAALYAASSAGVKIDLIVRGVCALRPGVKGVSENIRVRSVVGRFLEHTRIFYVGNGGEPTVWLSSADWMERNFFRRVEVAFPILDPKLQKRVIDEGLAPYVADGCGAWQMDADGVYTRDLTTAQQSAQRTLLTGLASEFT